MKYILISKVALHTMATHPGSGLEFVLSYENNQYAKTAMDIYQHQSCVKRDLWRSAQRTEEHKHNPFWLYDRVNLPQYHTCSTSWMVGRWSFFRGMWKICHSTGNHWWRKQSLLSLKAKQGHSERKIGRNHLASLDLFFNRSLPPFMVGKPWPKGEGGGVL